MADPPADNAGDDKSELLEIPDAWKRAPRGSTAAKDGYGWYRCAVAIPAAWKGQDIELFMEAVDDTREAFVNGSRMGGFGNFPPKFRSGLGGAGRFPVDAKDIRPGEDNIVAIRVYKEAARENFNVAAPVLFSGDDAIRLSGKWEFRSGDDAKWTMTLDTSDEARKLVISKVEKAGQVVKTLKKIKDDDGALSVEDTLKRISLPDDLGIDAVLSEPDIGQPLSIKWDERGRLWLVEYLQYPNPAGLKMVSRDKYLRSVYDKVPPAPPNHFKGADRISIHEDTNGDGRLDKHTKFVDGLSIVSSFAIGRNGVFVLNPPYLLYYPDEDRDDQPDADPEVLLEGFGIEDSHSVANSLRWGPDGWLYACQGSTVTGNIKRPGTKDKPVHSMGQLVWRYHPETRRYEIFAEGGGNAFGLEIDSKGRTYSGHNGGDTRGFHYVQGGYYRKGFGKHGELSNPYSFGYFPHMQHSKVPRFTHNFVIYEDNQLPPAYHGILFGVEPLQSDVIFSKVETDGSSFKTQDLGHAMKSKDTWVRPVDIKVGPDGALYVVDLYEQRIDHASHYQGRVHKESGRIYRISGRDASETKARSNTTQQIDLSQLSSHDLVQDVLSQSDNRWRRQTAIRLLADRKDKTVVPEIKKSIVNATGQYALELLWALHVSGGFDEEIALMLLDHDEPHVRLWTVRLLCDDNQAEPRLVRKMAAIAATEPSVEVRSQLACSARRLQTLDDLTIVLALLTRSEDTNDVHLPLLLWWAIEAKCEADGDRVAQVFEDQQIWSLDIVREHVIERLMRRFAQAGRRKDLLICARLLNLAPKPEDAKLLLAGFEKAYEGRELTKLPAELVSAIANSGGGSLALRIRQLDKKAIEEGLKSIQDEAVAAKQRVQLVRIFGQLAHQQSLPVLLQLVRKTKDDAVRTAALNSLKSFDDDRVSTTVIDLYATLSDSDRDVAATLLSSRENWASAFAVAVEQESIARGKVPMSAVRKMLLHRNTALQDAVAKVWGEVEGATTDQMLKNIERLKDVLGEASGNPYNGKRMYMQTCGKCHILFGQGGYVGPDLTPYKRDDLQRMLLNVVNPSIEIREGFETHVVYTNDGRVLNGFIADQDNQIVELKGVDGQSTIVARSDIDEINAVKRSIMPEGVLKDYDDQQIRDLFAYLRATQPLP